MLLHNTVTAWFMWLACYPLSFSSLQGSLLMWPIPFWSLFYLFHASAGFFDFIFFVIGYLRPSSLYSQVIIFLFSWRLRCFSFLSLFLSSSSNVYLHAHHPNLKFSWMCSLQCPEQNMRCARFTFRQYTYSNLTVFICVCKMGSGFMAQSQENTPQSRLV